MSRGIRLQIELKQRDRQQIDQLLGGGLQSVRTTLRALALRQLDQGQSTPAVGANLGLSAKAVWQICKRYLDGGLERALFDAARPGKAPALDQQQQQRIIAVACSPPPEGRARWTVRLLTEEVIKRKLVPHVGRETIRVLCTHNPVVRSARAALQSEVACPHAAPPVFRPRKSPVRLQTEAFRMS